MDDLNRCLQCNRLFLTVLKHTCDLCGKIFCSSQCKLVHKCNELPDLIAPWDEEDAIDLSDLFKIPDDRDIYGCNQLKQRDGSLVCYRCKKEKALWDDLHDGPPVCLSCYRKLRQEFLSLLGWPEKKGELFTYGYRIYRLINEHILDSLDIKSLLGASVKLTKFVIVEMKVRSRTVDRSIKIKIGDLYIIYLDVPTILFIDKRILEFIPGLYSIVAEQGI